MLRTEVGKALFGVLVGGSVCIVYAVVRETARAITRACDSIGR